MANPLGYPPKDPGFLHIQRRTGYKHEMYRRQGDSIFNAALPATAAAIALRTQPMGGLGPFQAAPPRGSNVARAMIARAAANRGPARTVPLGFLLGYTPPRPRLAERNFSQNTIDAVVARFSFALLNIAFVRQLGWVCCVESCSVVMNSDHLMHRTKTVHGRFGATTMVFWAGKATWSAKSV